MVYVLLSSLECKRSNRSVKVSTLTSTFLSPQVSVFQLLLVDSQLLLERVSTHCCSEVGGAC